MAQLPESQRRIVEEAVRRDLPGWRVSPADGQRKKAATSATGLSVKRVGDLDQLRKKFLSGRPTVDTVVVESLDGRYRKVADVVDGHATIVQG